MLAIELLGLFLAAAGALYGIWTKDTIECPSRHESVASRGRGVVGNRAHARLATRERPLCN